MKTITFILTLLFIAPTAVGQTLDYQLQHSTIPYTPANSLQKVSPESFANGGDPFEINLPFPFIINDKEYNSILVFEEGLLGFLTPAENLEHAIFAMGAPLVAKDSTSGIYIETSGNAGERVFTIEYRWFGVKGGKSTDHTTFAILLYESSYDFEIRYGLHSDFDTELFLLEKGSIVGLFTQDTILYTSKESYYLTDSSHTPKLNFDIPSDSIPFSLCGHPATNTSYRFIKTQNSLSNKAINTTTAKVYPNPISTGSLFVELNTFNNYTLQLKDLQGKTITQKSFFNANKLYLPADGIESGMYLLSISSKNNLITTKKIIIN